MKKGILIGCGGIIALFFILLTIGGIWLLSGPEGRVRLPNEMEKYATIYLEENKILDDSEELLSLIHI